MTDIVSTSVASCQWRGAKWPIVVTALVASSWAGTVTAIDAHSIEVSFSGTMGVAFQADCVLMTAKGSDPIAFVAEVPQRYSLVGLGLECRISRTEGGGRMMVEINKAGRTISRASVAAGAGTTLLTVR